MKSWSQMLHKLLRALAFANAGNLGSLQRMLQADDAPADAGTRHAPHAATAPATSTQCAEIIPFPQPRERASRNAA